MIILGLHFGHDAAVCVLRDGYIIAYYLRERHTGVKHALGLDWRAVERALEAADITASEVDFCAITSTQDVEIILHDPDRFSITPSPASDHPNPGTLYRLVPDISEKLQGNLLDALYRDDLRDSLQHKLYRHLFPEHVGRARDSFQTLGCLDNYIDIDAWAGRHTLADIGKTDYSQYLETDDARFGFHYPIQVHLHELTIPGYFIHHHLAHAAASYYASGFEQAAILTHDGFASGENYNSGMFYLGRGNAIYPLAPHHLQMGRIYDQAAMALNLGDVGGAGKLMGLAPYGQPVFYAEDFRGNCYDGDQDQWLDHCVGRAGEMGYDLDPIGNGAKVLEPVCRDIAASTQKLFEESMLAAAASLHAALQSSGATPKNLCFSGGTALNCPANSLIAREGPFENMFIEPYCDDGGLAIGAAQAVYHSILDHPLAAGQKIGAYIGGGVGDVDAILEKFAGKIDAVSIEDPAKRAAEELADDRIIAWIEGRSEAGPRALCHRSVLANPTSKENWARVNIIKKREHWRPLAPVVLADEAAEWFDGAPLPSPFMLFTGQVTSDKLPAITHVDGSARIQTVDGTMGDFYHLLKSFYALTEVPVLLNTSLNGPGAPIAETLEDALPLLLETDLDALYCAGYRITKIT